ncbi:MAG TPA: hypothetical protein VFX49_21260 [Chloroflexota bacterium]|nr:hypothetical protein [Chloroflexota bacterium]
MSDTAAPPATAAVSIRTTAANSKWLNAASLGSGKQIAAGDQVVMCPKCFKPVLLDDWRGNGNKCPEDGTPARVIEPRGRAAGGDAPAAAAPAAPAALAAPAAAPAAAPWAAAPAAAAAAAPAAVAGPAAVNVVVDPYRYARPVDAPPVSDVWRRNIMTIFWLLVVWGAIVLLVWLLGLGPSSVTAA